VSSERQPDNFSNFIFTNPESNLNIFNNEEYMGQANLISMKDRIQNMRSMKENRTRNNNYTNHTTFTNNQLIRYHTSDGQRVDYEDQEYSSYNLQDPQPYTFHTLAQD